MKNLISGIMAVALVAGPASAQQPHVTTTLPSATVKLNGASGGGGSGTGFVCDAGDLVCLFQAPAGYAVEIISDSGITFTGDVSNEGDWSLSTSSNEMRPATTLSSTGTVLGSNVRCSTGGGAVVGTLLASEATTGRFVYVTRSGANTCTIGVESGHTLDGVTDGTTTIANGGSKTFKQSGDTAWITTTEYPVTGTLSGLTAGKLILATGAAAGADSAITHDSTTGVTTFAGSGPKLVLNDFAGGATPAILYWDLANQLFRFRNSTDSADVNLYANVVSALSSVQAGGFSTVGDSFGLYDDGYAGAPYLTIKAGGEIAWPLTAGSATQRINDKGLQISQSKALVDATATAFSRVAVASNSYEGGVLHYTIFATDATDYQNRSGSVSFSVLNVGGTETCVFGTAADAVNVSAGTLTVTWDCAAGTDTVDLRATADTSLASTTIFTIQARVDLTSGIATVTPQ